MSGRARKRKVMDGQDGAGSGGEDEADEGEHAREI